MPNKLPNQFVVIVDSEGDAFDIVAAEDDLIWAMIRVAEKQFPEYKPYVPWLWDGSKWKLWDNILINKADKQQSCPHFSIVFCEVKDGIDCLDCGSFFGKEIGLAMGEGKVKKLM